MTSGLETSAALVALTLLPPPLPPSPPQERMWTNRGRRRMSSVMRRINHSHGG